MQHALLRHHKHVSAPAPCAALASMQGSLVPPRGSGQRLGGAHRRRRSSPALPPPLARHRPGSQRRLQLWRQQRGGWAALQRRQRRQQGRPSGAPAQHGAGGGDRGSGARPEGVLEPGLGSGGRAGWSCRPLCLHPASNSGPAVPRKPGAPFPLRSLAQPPSAAALSPCPHPHPRHPGRPATTTRCWAWRATPTRRPSAVPSAPSRWPRTPTRSAMRRGRQKPSTSSQRWGSTAGTAPCPLGKRSLVLSRGTAAAGRPRGLLLSCTCPFHLSPRLLSVQACDVLGDPASRQQYDQELQDAALSSGFK